MTSNLIEYQPHVHGGGDGDGDDPHPFRQRTYWDGYTEGRESGELHGRNIAEIEGRFAADDAERRGYERGRQDGINECGWPQLLRDLGGFLQGLFWVALILGLWAMILADTFDDGKKAGREEALKQSSVVEKAR